MLDKTSLEASFARFDDLWRPKVVADLNGQEIKLVKAKGEFPWHVHDDVDEMFLVWKGRFCVEFRDKVVELGPGEICIAPMGVEHRTTAKDIAEVVIFEPKNVLNTGNVRDDVYTAPKGARL